MAWVQDPDTFSWYYVNDEVPLANAGTADTSYVFNPAQDSQLASTQLGLTGSSNTDMTGAAVPYGQVGAAGTTNDITKYLNKLLGTSLTDKNIASLGIGAGALLGLSGLGRSTSQPVGYQGKVPKMAASRSQLPAAVAATQQGARAYGAPAQGRQYFSPMAYTKQAAQGGVMSLATGGLAEGGFVVPADVVSHLGNGSSSAGLAVLAERMGAQPIKGDGDGMSDSIPTKIDGKRPALVANDEAYLPPEKVAAIGGGDMKKGAQKLYALMDKIRQERTGSKEQGKQISPEKFLPGEEVRFATGDTVPSGTTGVESSLSNWAGDYVTNMLGQGQALAEQPYQAYTGQLTAGTSPLSQQAYDQASSWQTPYSVTQAANTLGNLSQTNAGMYTPGQFTSQYSPITAGQTVDFNNQFSSPAIGAGTTQFTNQYNPTGAYNYTNLGNQYQTVGGYNTTQFGNQFNAPTATQQTQFTNQYNAPGAYNYAAAGNLYQGTAPYQAGQFTNQFNFTPSTAGTTQFTNQYQAPDAYTTGNITSKDFDTAAAQQYMNPYLQMSLQPQLQEASRQSQLTQLQNAAKMSQAGAYGGSRQALMDTETQRNLLQNMSNIVGQGYNTAYTTAQNQFNTDQSRQLQAQQATEASRQFGAQQAATAAQLQAQYGMSAQQAQEAARQFNSGQALTAAQLQAQYGLSAQQATEASRQFGAQQGLTNAQNQAQYGLAALNANINQQQFGAQQAQTAAQLQAQYGLSAQQAQEAARQFTSGQAMTAAQLQAQYGLSAQQAAEASKQFGYTSQLQQAQNAAQYGMSAAQLNAQQQQFGATQAQTAAQLQAQYGLSAQQAQEAARQFNAGQGMTAAQLQAQYGLSAQQAQQAANQFNTSTALQQAQSQAQYGLAAQQAQEASRQFGANLGLQGLQQQITAAQGQGQLGLQSGNLGLQALQQLGTFGQQQQATEQAALDAQKAQFEAERDNPYKMVQFQQSLLQGLPLAAQNYSTATPSSWQEALGGAAGIASLLQSLGYSVPGSTTTTTT